MKKIILSIIFLLGIGGMMYYSFNRSISAPSNFKKVTVPAESETHEATWLIWPHEYTYGVNYRNSVEQTWIDMTKALVKSEKVKLIVYNVKEKNRIVNLLKENEVELDSIQFIIEKTDDVWARDTGPLFVYDADKKLHILDFKFNGWGEKVPYKKDEKLAYRLSQKLTIDYLKTPLVLEPGAIEIDGNGVLVATESSIINENRNPNLHKKDVNSLLKKWLPIEKIIWLKGLKDVDITDMHIDGFFKFYDTHTIITLEDSALKEWGLNETDIATINTMTTVDNVPYKRITLPLTQNTVKLPSGKDLGYKGSYINYYIANTVVLVPIYNDVNDEVAKDLFRQLYPTKEIIGIDCRTLYQYGGMIHCVTQQEPVQQ